MTRIVSMNSDNTELMEEWEEKLKKWREEKSMEGMILDDQKVMKNLLEAGTTSVLEYLKNEKIVVKEVRKRLKANYFRACRRLAGFSLLKILV